MIFFRKLIPTVKNHTLIIHAIETGWQWKMKPASAASSYTKSKHHLTSITFKYDYKELQMLVLKNNSQSAGEGCHPKKLPVHIIQRYCLTCRATPAHCVFFLLPLSMIWRILIIVSNLFSYSLWSLSSHQCISLIRYEIVALMTL